MIDITLHKLKYRNPNRKHIKEGSRKGTDNVAGGTFVWQSKGQPAKQRTNPPVKKGRTLRPPRRSWGPVWSSSEELR